MTAARRLIGVGCSAVLSAALLAGVLTALAPEPASATPLTVNIDWLVGAGAIGLVNGYVGNGSLTTSAFDNPNTYVTGNPGQTWVSSTTASFTAFGPPGSPGSFEYALAHNLIPQGTSYVLYDLENWALTPPAEQQNPEFYMSEFVQLATDRGYGAILAPAVDLSNAMSCHRSADSDFTNYLTDCNLPLLAAEAVVQAAGHKCVVSQSCTNPPPIYEVQAQRFESNTSLGSSCACYAWFANTAATEAHSYAPGLTVFAGISSNHDGVVATASQLDSDVLNTTLATSPPSGSIDGYWLNVPMQGTACPNCTLTGDPESAAGLLWDLGFAGVGSQSIAFTPPTAAVVGTSQIVTATGSGSGSPVQLSVDASSTQGACSLGAGGTVLFTGAGNCVIDANQASATDWNAAPQARETIPVAPASQAIAFTPPAPDVVGDAARLAAAGGPSGNPVVFGVDPSSTAGACSLAGDGVTLDYTGAGSCIVDANEAGNANYLAAPQVMATVVIGSGTQSISFTPPSFARAGTSATVSATGGGSGNPVVFSIDPSSGAGVCSASGPYGSVVSFLAVGSCVLDANEAPSASGYLGAPQVVRTIAVGVGSQTVSFVPPSGAVVGASAQLVATGGASTQPVVFSVDPTSGRGVCSVTGPDGDLVDYTAAGVCVIDATQQGDANFVAAAVATSTITVAPGPQTIAFSPPSGATYGTSQQLQASGGGSLNPVVFSLNPSSDAVCSPSGDNGATVDYTGIGNCILDLNEAGNDNYSAAPMVVDTIEVGGTPQSISFSPPSTGVFGETTVLSASGGASGQPVTFAVDPASTEDACALASDGVTLNYTGAGSCVVDATEAGSGTYGSTTVTSTIAITQAQQTITAQAPPDGEVGGTVALSGTGGASGNPVQFALDPSSGRGVCSVVGGAVEYLAVGSCILDAYQASSDDYSAASATLPAAAVSQGTQQISLQQTPAGVVGGDGLLEATSNSSSGLPIVFSIDNSSDSGTCSISPSDNSTVVFTGTGNCVVDADQAGDANYLAAQTAMETIAVGEGSPTLSVNAPEDAAAGTSAVLSGSGGLSANSIVFSLNPGSGAGVCALSGPDGATVTFSAVGSCIVDANKASDGNYAAAAPVTTTIDVGPGSQSISFSPPDGGAVGSITSLTASDAGGGTQPIVFSVDPSSTPGACAVSGTDGAVLSFSGVGTCQVDANQAADANFAAAPTALADIEVSPGAQTIFFTPAVTAQAGTSVMLTATATSASGVPVVFSIDPSTMANVCHVAGEDGEALASDGVGTCIVDANEGGDSLYNPAQTVVAAIQVSPGSQTIYFSPPASGILGASVALTPSSSSASGLPVVISVDATTVPGVCWVGGATVHYVGVGQCTLDANEASDTDYAAAPTVSGTISIALGTQQISRITTTPSAVVGNIATLSASGGATGNPVVFSLDGTSGTGVCSLTGVVVTYIAAGACVIDANQAGNADYLTAPTEVQTITVAPATQVITFSAPPASIGEVETLGATTNSLNPVIYSLDPASGSGVCSLSGIDSSTVTYSALGTCVVDANAPGTANFLPAPQVPVTIHVRMALQFITFVPPSPGSVGQSAVLSATSSGATVNPITFSVDPTLSGAGVCALSGPNGGTVAYTSVGTCVIDANQLGDSNYKPAPLVWVTIAVGPGAQAINFTSQPVSPIYGGTYVPVATGGASGNPVVLTSATPSVCTFSGGGVVSFVGAGTCTIDANQTGSSNYLAARQQTQSFAVARASQNISLTANPGVFAGFETVAATGGASGNPVLFTVDVHSAAGVCALAIAGSATVLFTGVGNCMLDANEKGNTDYAPAPQVVLTIPVTAATQTISFTAPATATFGGSAALVASATSGLPVALTVDSGSGSGVCTIAAGASTVNFTRSGTCLIDANQKGNADYQAAPRVQQEITVGRAPQAISFVAPASAVYGTSVVLNATGGASHNPVIFAVATTSGKGVCSVSGSNVSFTGVGNCIVNANEAGNSDYLPAPQVQRTIKVTKAPQKVVITSSAPNHATYKGPTYVLTASGGGSENPVVYSSLSRSVCSVSGATVSFVGVGTCNLSASQAGSSNYNTGSAAQKFTVYKSPPPALAHGPLGWATLIGSAKTSGEGTPMAGNLAVRFQDGAFGLAVLVTAAAALHAWVVRIVPPTMKLATVRSSHRPGTQPRGYNTTR